MRFRKRRFPLRRRSGATMLPLSICGGELVIPPGHQCVDPSIDMFQLAGLHGRELITMDNTDPSVSESTLRKSLMVTGIRFHWGVQVVNTLVQDTDFFISGRCAIVKLEIDDVGAPIILPNLYSRIDARLGDVLWRGAFILRGAVETADASPNFAGIGNAQTAGSMSRDGSHSPMEHIKTKRRLTPTQALFFVVNCHNPLADMNGDPDNTVFLGLEFFGVAAVRSIQR